MKDHRQVERRVALWEMEGPIPQVVDYIDRLSSELVNPCMTVVTVGGVEDEGYLEMRIIGWVPMTEEEKRLAVKEHKQERERRKLRTIIRNFRDLAKEAKREDEVRYLRKQAEKLGFEVIER